MNYTMENNSLKNYQKNLGIEVRFKRKLLGLTQKELAQKLNITHEWVNKIERFKANKISSDLIFKITDFLNIDNSLLFKKTKDGSLQENRSSE